MKYLLISVISLMLISCGTVSKNKATFSASVDSTELREKDRLLKAEREKTMRLENELKELQYTGFVFNDESDCDTAATRLLVESLRNSYGQLTEHLADSFTRVLKAKENTVKFYADGSSEASGALKAANNNRTLLQKQLTVWMDKADSLVYENEQLKKNVKVEVKETVRQVVKVRWPWWLWPLLAITAIVCLLLGARYHKQINFLISKLKIMKTLKAFFGIVTLFVLQSCAKFKGTDVSVFAEGGWLVPLVPAVLAGVFAFKMWKQYKGGSWKIINGKVTNQDGGIIPFWKVPYFKYVVICVLATIAVIVGFNIEK